MVDQPEDVTGFEEVLKIAQSTEISAISVKAQLEHLRDQLLDKATELKIKEQFSALGPNTPVDPSIVDEIHSDLKRALKGIARTLNFQANHKNENRNSDNK